MDDIERTIRKTDLKEASGMDASEEYGVLLEEFCKIDASEKGLSPEEAREEAKRNYTKVFGRILPTDPTEIVLENTDRIEELTDQIEEEISEKDFSAECFKALVEIEIRLNLAWNFVMLSTTDMVPDRKQIPYLSYVNEKLWAYAEPMFKKLYDKVDNEAPYYGLSLDDWREYYDQEIITNKYIVKFIREAVKENNKLDILFVSLMVCFMFYPRSRFLACKYLQSRIEE